MFIRAEQLETVSAIVAAGGLALWCDLRGRVRRPQLCPGTLTIETAARPSTEVDSLNTVVKLQAPTFTGLAVAIFVQRSDPDWAQAADNLILGMLKPGEICWRTEKRQYVVLCPGPDANARLTAISALLSGFCAAKEIFWAGVDARNQELSEVVAEANLKLKQTQRILSVSRAS